MAKPTPQPDDPAQSKRFIEMATELETDAAPGAFDRAFRKVATAERQPPAEPKRKKR